MSYAVNCPHCRKSLQAKDGLAGRTVKCPACQGSFVVPMANLPPDVVVSPLHQTALHQTAINPRVNIRPSKHVARRSNRTTLIASILSGGIVFVLIVTALFLFLKKSPRPNEKPTDKSVATANSTASTPATVNSQPDSQPPSDKPTVKIEARWTMGEKRKFSIAKTRLANPLKGSNGLLQVELEIEVLGDEADSYLIGWTYSPPQHHPFQSAENHMDFELGNLINEFQVRLRLDRQARLVAIENVKELQEMAVAKWGESQVVGPRIITKQEVRPEIREWIEQLFGDEQAIKNLFTRETQILFHPIGHSYSETPTTSRDTVPNPFGGEPFTLEATLQLKSFSRSPFQAVISWTQKHDVQVVQETMRKTLDVVKGNGKLAKDEFLCGDSGEYVIDLESGWPIDIQLSHLWIGHTAETEQATVNVKRY